MPSFMVSEIQKITIENKEQLDEIIEDLENETFKIREIKKGERSKKAPLPFTTSTLQARAANVLNFSTQKTMRLAQQLYEGVEIKGEGTIGIITSVEPIPQELRRKQMLLPENL